MTNKEERLKRPEITREVVQAACRAIKELPLFFLEHDDVQSKTERDARVIINAAFDVIYPEVE